jgi:type II secretory pathway component GspD/PulD (secretin)
MSGALSIIPGLGFNGTLVDPDVADVVLRALTDHHRSRVTSAPRILVNDNAEGELSSVAEVPFTSLNASNTVATTSFAGFAEAGTTITVTPRISDDKHLQLDFAITLNTFTGAGSQGVPPPRQTDEVRSQVTIPDGHTVIVGGLNRTGNTWDFTSFPFVDKVPLLRYLGGNESRNQNSSSMFVFIRPIILRDDKFRDLKYLSGNEVHRAGECPDYPTSEPVWIP